jgi:hypothetical protein
MADPSKPDATKTRNRILRVGGRVRRRRDLHDQLVDAHPTATALQGRYFRVVRDAYRGTERHKILAPRPPASTEDQGGNRGGGGF